MKCSSSVGILPVRAGGPREDDPPKVRAPRKVSPKILMHLQDNGAAGSPGTDVLRSTRGRGLGTEAKGVRSRSIEDNPRHSINEELTMTDIRTDDVTYTAGETTCKGHIAYDAAAGEPRPGVLVVHEWWGLDDYIRGRARMLAELGYTALAADMYGDGRTAADPDGAAALMNAVLGDMESGAARFRAAFDALSRHPSVDAGPAWRRSATASAARWSCTAPASAWISRAW